MENSNSSFSVLKLSRICQINQVLNTTPGAKRNYQWFPVVTTCDLLLLVSEIQVYWVTFVFD